MKTVLIAERFDKARAAEAARSLGIGTRRLIGQWHLHPDAAHANRVIAEVLRGERSLFDAFGVADGWAPYADRFGKGHHPYTEKRIRDVASGLGDVDLNIEVGRQTERLFRCSRELFLRRVSVHRHTAGLTSKLAAHGTYVGGDYATGMLDAPDGVSWDSLTLADRMVHEFKGRPRRIIISGYGRVDLRWVARVTRAAHRAATLAKHARAIYPHGSVIEAGPTVCVYCSPFDGRRATLTRGGEPWMSVPAFAEHVYGCVRIARQIERMGADAQLAGWLDAGRLRDVDGDGDPELVRAAWSEAEPYVEVLAQKTKAWREAA